MSFRIGQGYDIHRLVEGRPLILGGITIDYEKGLRLIMKKDFWVTLMPMRFCMLSPMLC